LSLIVSAFHLATVFPRDLDLDGHLAAQWVGVFEDLIELGASRWIVFCQISAVDVL
jgi:hypothetical protein